MVMFDLKILLSDHGGFYFSVTVCCFVLFSSNSAVCHIKTVHCCVYLMLYCINMYMYNHLIYLNQMLYNENWIALLQHLFSSTLQNNFICYVIYIQNMKIYTMSNIWIVDLFIICILLCSLYCLFIDIVSVSLSIINWSRTFSSI